MGRLGTVVHCSTKLPALQESADGVVIQSQKISEAKEIQVDCALHCTGWKPVSTSKLKSHYSANIVVRDELIGSGFVKAVFQQDKMIGAMVTGDHAPEISAPLSRATSAGLTRKQLKF